MSAETCAETCVVFVCNAAYFQKFEETCRQLVSVGDYHGDICLIYGNDLVDSPLLESEIIHANRVIVLYFPDFEFPMAVLETMGTMRRDPIWMQKLFQFHKFHIFDTRLCCWSRILYLDCGITIYGQIRPILDAFVPGRLLAHSDAYPSYVWELGGQFEHMEPYYSELAARYDMRSDYFQTTMMYFDTAILAEGLPQKLFELACQFPICRTNDQGIIALYFLKQRLFRQICLQNRETYFYDYLRRDPTYRYIMLKNAAL